VFRKENTKRKNERGDWGFSALESIFDSYLSVTGSRVDGYYLYGHSAGAQFVHRHLAFISAGGAPLRVIRAVAANSGFYTLPTFEIPFPFGFGGTESVFSEEDLRNYLQAPLTVVLGELDDDHHHKHLNRSEGAMQQGPHRLARGRHFYEAGAKMARTLGVPFGWSMHYVPGVGHSDGRMSRASMQYLFKDRHLEVCVRPGGDSAVSGIALPSAPAEAAAASTAAAGDSDGEESTSSTSESDEPAGVGNPLRRDESAESF